MVVLLHDDLSNTILLEGEIGDEIKIMANPSPSINSWGGQHRTKSQGTEKKSNFRFVMMMVMQTKDFLRSCKMSRKSLKYVQIQKG